MMILDVNEIHTYYDTAHILQGVSLTIAKGEVVSLLGRNGAGKTTTIKSIIGLVPPKRGEILFQGERISKLSSYRIARKGIGLIPEDRRIFPTLTVRENLEIAKYGRKLREEQWTVERIYDLFPLLQKLDRRRGKDLSGGEQQLLSIARALMGSPTLLLVDEPTEGLAPVIVDQIQELLLEIRKTVTILLSVQNARFAYLVSDRAYVIDKGMVQFEGSMEELKGNELVERKYLAV
jgi:branched-chain amino acid transport system ATP-binding protein